MHLCRYWRHDDRWGPQCQRVAYQKPTHHHSWPTPLLLSGSGEALRQQSDLEETVRYQLGPIYKKFTVEVHIEFSLLTVSQRKSPRLDLTIYLVQLDGLTAGAIFYSNHYYRGGPATLSEPSKLETVQRNDRSRIINLYNMSIEHFGRGACKQYSHRCTIIKP